eukprot:TRINITY_DN863_c0_g1_i1.p1 TRINITY_DN863_c0_g1~~TRINITY_DN863_c0_g1_i1.p1  ORF type:complete len:3361 (+),score=1140.56 TRINITY_DN863_c0_g1_i1:103-10185(+)
MAGDADALLPYPVQLLRRAQRAPDALALVYGECEVTAGELARRAVAVVRALEVVVAPGGRVAICCEKGVEWVVACYACSLGQYPFTVVDKRLTPQQQGHIWATWAPEAVVAVPSTPSLSLVPADLAATLPVIDLTVDFSGTDITAPRLPPLDIDMGVYVDWTSGTSSGKPKGVICRHRHLLHMLAYRQANYPLGDDERVGVNMFPLWYWWMPMTLGRPAVLIPDAAMLDTDELMPYLQRWGVTRIDCMTPSLLKVWMQDRRATALTKMRLFVVSGEPLPLTTARLVHAALPHTAVLNMLSTTEAGDVMFMELCGSVTDALIAAGIENCPVGAPMPTVDVALQPYEGDAARLELLVSGTGVPPDAEYLGDELADAFRDAGGARTWFTKDCASRRDVAIKVDGAGEGVGFVGACFRALCDARGPGEYILRGLYELRGRLNNTAKVRGFRVDMGAVQSAMRKVTFSPRPGARVPRVVDATALVSNDTLVAFLAVVYGDDDDAAAAPPRELAREARAHCETVGELAQSHVPSAYHFVKQLPLTNTGKVNEITLRSWAEEGVPQEAGVALLVEAAAARPPTAAAASASTDADAARVRAAWEVLFGKDVVAGVGDDVSMWDIGAHSLMLTSLGAALGVKVVDLFELETIAEQAAKLKTARSGAQGDAALAAAAASPNAPIAIVGIGVRWPCPGGDSLRGVYASLLSPDPLAVELSDETLAAAGVPAALLRDPGYVKRGVLMDTEYVQGFDCAFWGMSKGEVLAMDPNNRALLEVSLEALLDSGYAYGVGKEYAVPAPAAPTRNVGVFAAGGSLPQYLTDVLGEDTVAARTADPSRYWALEVGNDKDYCATRVAYALNLHGPAETVQTACSSGLSTVATAVDALRLGKCEAALAIAACIPVPQDAGYLHQPGMVWAADGRCRPFDAEAGGTAPGAAVVAFALKPLAAAEAAGDRVYAVVRGCGVSNDGGRKHTFHAPSKAGQVEALRRALRDAAVDPRDITMVEAHGTGTPLGDPIEIAGLLEGYGIDADADASDRRPIHLGSVKGHIGHANTAAGAAGLLRAVLALHGGVAFPTANYSKPMTALDGTPFRVGTAAAAWTAPRRVCGVSSFGVGGTNVHLICEAYTPPCVCAEPPAAPNAAAPPVLLLASGRTERGAREAAARLERDVLKGDGVTPADLRAAEAALLKRPVYRYRSAALAHRGSTSVAAAADAGAGAAPVVLCFPGQGGYRPGVGSGLLACRSLPAFRAAIDAVEGLLGAPVLSPPPASNRGEQLLLFSVGYALARTLREQFGVAPAAVMGHSLGEIVAATVAGVFTLPDALAFVAERGAIIDDLAAPGSMMSVAAPRATVEAYLATVADATPSVEIACVNAEERVVLAGDAAELEWVKERQAGWSCVMLRVRAGFHSRAVDAGLPRVRAKLAGMKLARPALPIVSTLTGKFVSGEEVTTAEYWVNHMRQPVLFHTAVQAAHAAHPSCVVAEVGPQLLTSCVRASLGTGRACAFMAKPGKAPAEDEPAAVWGAAAALWQHGASVDWARALESKNGAEAAAPANSLSPLPPPAYARERVWPAEPAHLRAAESDAAPAAGQDAERLARRYARIVPMCQPGEAQLLEYRYDRVALPADVAGFGDAAKTWPAVALDGGLVVGDKLLPCRGAADIVAAAKRYQRLVITGGRAAARWNAWGEDDTAAPAVDPDAAVARLAAAVEALQVLLDPEHQLPAVRVVVAVPDTPTYAPVIGAARCAAREAPQLNIQRLLLKVKGGAGATGAPPLIDVLAAAGSLRAHEELRAEFGGGTFTMAAARLAPLPAHPAPARPALAEQAAGKVVVVTGGTQGVGRALARHCVAAGAAQVVVLARNPPASSEDGVEFARCDMSDEDAVRGVVRWLAGGAAASGLPRLAGPVGAFFHCAGVITDAVVAKINTEAAALHRLVAAKVHAVAYLLTEAAKAQQDGAALPPLHLFSSSSAVLGPAGQGTYSAANAYVDAMAAAYRRGGLDVRALQWGGWTLGMSERFAIKPLQGEAFFGAAQGMAALEALLAGEPAAPTAMLVSIPSWRQYARAVGLPAGLVAPLLAAEAEAAVGADHPLLGCRHEVDLVGACHDAVWPAAFDEHAMAERGLLWLSGHRVDGGVIVPGTLWVELMVQAVAAELEHAGKRTRGARDPVTLHAVRFRAALDLPASAAGGRAAERVVRTAVDTSAAPWRVQVCSRAVAGSDEWTVHADADLGAYTTPVPPPPADAARRKVPICGLYEAMAKQGFEYRGPFRCGGVLEEADAPHRHVALQLHPRAVGGSFFTGHSPAALDAASHLSSLLGNDGYPSRIEAFTAFPAAAEGEAAAEVLKAVARPDLNDRVDLAVREAGSGRLVAAARGFETVSSRPDPPCVKQVVFAASAVEETPPSAESPSSSAASWETVGHDTWVVVGGSAGGALVEALRAQGVLAVDAAVERTSVADAVNGRLVGVAVIGTGPGAVSAARDALTALRACWRVNTQLVCVCRDGDDGAAAEALVDHAGLPEPAVILQDAAAEPAAVAEALAGCLSCGYMAEVAGGAMRIPELLDVPAVETAADAAAPAAEVTVPEGAYAVEVTAGVGGYAAPFVPTAAPEPSAEEVVVEVGTWALNFLDVFLASGVLSNARLGKVGGECCGTVVAVGSGCRDRFRVGDVVAGLTTAASGLGSHGVLHAHGCAVVPPQLADAPEVASTVTLVYGTAWLALKWLARVRPGDKVLIHAASGGVGQACVHLARLFGGVPICTVSTQAKRDFLTEHCGVPPEHIFNSRDALSFSTGVQEAFGDVDVVVNSLAGDSMRASLRLLAPFGRFVELGKRDQQNHTAVDLNLFAMGQAYMSAHLDVLMQRPAEMQRLLGEVWAAHAEGGLPELSSVSYGVARTAEAMDLLNSGKHIGKVLISCPQQGRGGRGAAAAAPADPELPRAHRDLQERLRADLAAAAAPLPVTWVASPTAFADAAAAPAPHALLLCSAAMPRPATPAVLSALARRANARVVVLVEAGVVLPGVRTDAVARAAAAAIRDGAPAWFVVAQSAARMPLVLAPEAEALGGEAVAEAELAQDVIQSTIVDHVAARMKLPAEDVDLDAGFAHLGFDSLAQLQLAHALRAAFGVPTVAIHDKLSVRALVASLAAPGAAESDAAKAVTTVAPDAVEGARRPLRLLCLHGFRSSKALMLSKLRPLVEDGSVELVLANAPHAARGKGDPNIPESEKTYEWWWFDGCRGYDEGFHLERCEGLHDSIAFLAALEGEHGPFDGVVGFSQGAGMAHLAAQYGIGRFLVLFSPVFSYDVNLPPGRADGAAAAVAALPALHLFDPSESYRRHCQHAVDSFTSPVLHHHDQGHDMTLSTDVLSALKAFLQGRGA